MPQRPAPPFDLWPTADFYAPDYGYAWFCEGGVVVSHAEATWGYEAGVGRYLEWEAVVIERETDELRRAGGLYAIHDWRSVTGYDTGARTRWQQELRARPKGYLRGSTVVVERVAALLKMAVQAANLAASLTQAAKVEVTSDLDEVMRKHRPVPVRGKVAQR